MLVKAECFEKAPVIVDGRNRLSLRLQMVSIWFARLLLPGFFCRDSFAEIPVLLEGIPLETFQLEHPLRDRPGSSFGKLCSELRSERLPVETGWSSCRYCSDTMCPPNSGVKRFEFESTVKAKESGLSAERSLSPLAQRGLVRCSPVYSIRYISSDTRCVLHSVRYTVR